MSNGESFSELLSKHLRRLDQTASWLARRLRCYPSTTNRWLSGQTIPNSPATVIRIADVLGIHDDTERKAMMIAAGYAYVDGQQQNEEHSTQDEETTNYFDFMDALHTWFTNVRETANVRIDGDGRWEVNLMQVLRILGETITIRGLLVFMLVMVFWWLTYWLTAPILEWPIADRQTQFVVSVQFAVATLLIPILIAFLEQPDVSIVGWKAKVIFFSLRLAGALAGFYLFVSIALGLALTVFYLWSASLPTTIKWILVTLPPFFSYVAAYVIPLNRLRMFDTIRFHPVDRLVLVAFSIIGPLTAGFVYWEREMLQSRAFGGILFVLLFGLLLWLYKQQQPQAISDKMIIIIWGMVLPISLIILGIFIPPNASLSLRTLEFLIFIIHVLAQTLFIATLYVRGQTNIFWLVMLGILMFEFVALLVLIQSSALGLATVGIVTSAMGVLWFLGQRWLHRYLWSHNGFWLMQITLFVSIFVWAWALVPWWIETPVFLVSTAILIWWTYASGDNLSS